MGLFDVGVNMPFDHPMDNLTCFGQTPSLRQSHVVIVSSDSCDAIHLYFPTGELDYLMDIAPETKVFQSRFGRTLMWPNTPITSKR